MSTTTIATGKMNSRTLHFLRYSVEKMNKKAAKLKLAPMTVTVVGTEIVEDRHPVTNLFRTWERHEVIVEGEVPRINGWVVAAKIEFSEHGNFVSAAPGIENLSPEYRTAPNVCQHCYKKRSRNDLVVVRNEEGQEMMVGRNCLADFIRTGDAETMLAAAKWFGSVDVLMSDSEDADEYCRRSHFTPEESLECVLLHASVCIRKLGWAKAGDFNGSTKTDVAMLMNPPPCGDSLREWEKWVAKHELVYTDFDREEVARAMEWLKAQTASSDYMHNLCVLRDKGTVPDNKFGLAVSIIPVAKRAAEEDVKRAVRVTMDGPHVGSVGERLRKQEVTVLKASSIDGYYGVKTVVTFLTEGRSKLTWFASGDQTELYPVGQTMVITFTVKEHETHEKYGKQTIIQRVKDETPVEAPLEQAAGS